MEQRILLRDPSCLSSLVKVTVQSYYQVALPAILMATLVTELFLLFVEAQRLLRGGGYYKSPQDLNSIFSQRFFA